MRYASFSRAIPPIFSTRKKRISLALSGRERTRRPGPPRARAPISGKQDLAYLPNGVRKVTGGFSAPGRGTPRGPGRTTGGETKARRMAAGRLISANKGRPGSAVFSFGGSQYTFSAVACTFLSSTLGSSWCTLSIASAWLYPRFRHHHSRLSTPDIRVFWVVLRGPRTRIGGAMVRKHPISVAWTWTGLRRRGGRRIATVSGGLRERWRGWTSKSASSPSGSRSRYGRRGNETAPASGAIADPISIGVDDRWRTLREELQHTVADCFWSPA